MDPDRFMVSDAHMRQFEGADLRLACGNVVHLLFVHGSHSRKSLEGLLLHSPRTIDAALEVLQSNGYVESRKALSGDTRYTFFGSLAIVIPGKLGHIVTTLRLGN